MSPLRILILSDRRPGHYHLAEGVAAAIGRRRQIVVTKLEIVRRGGMPGRLLAWLLRAGASPDLVLNLGYGLQSRDLPPASLLISAGGDTLAATVAAARALQAEAIFCGTLRHFAPEDFALVISSYERHASLPRHLVTLKPSGLDPDTLPMRGTSSQEGGRTPAIAGLLVGGDSGLFSYRADEWQRLERFLIEMHASHGTRWIVSTSRRTAATVADSLRILADRANGPIAELIDFRTAGPGTLPGLFAGVEAILATEDSSTMMSEAVCARLPVVGVAPAKHAFKEEEREYRSYLAREGWIATVPLDQLTPGTFLAALQRVKPIEGNHLDRLADALVARLPALTTPDR